MYDLEEWWKPHSLETLHIAKEAIAPSPTVHGGGSQCLGSTGG
jgi:hypothetical protein